jgi:hypothetical protein
MKSNNLPMALLKTAHWREAKMQTAGIGCGVIELKRHVRAYHGEIAEPKHVELR